MSDDYEVGYGQPPKHAQFKKGQTGNPKGRPKGTKNLKTDLQEELEEKIVITEGGAGKKISKQRALIKSMMAKAVNGDARAQTLLFNMILKLMLTEAADASEGELTATDIAILEDFKREVLKSAKQS